MRHFLECDGGDDVFGFDVVDGLDHLQTAAQLHDVLLNEDCLPPMTATLAPPTGAATTAAGSSVPNTPPTSRFSLNKFGLSPRTPVQNLKSSGIYTPQHFYRPPMHGKGI